jgi:MerR family transcriptional regulator/heat shock protein HspR
MISGMNQDWRTVLEDPTAPLYTVGVVAELLDVDVQVVRRYDQEGMVNPGRTGGGQRRYSREDIERLARAISLADEGIPGPGIRRIMELEDRLSDLESPAGN